MIPTLTQSVVGLIFILAAIVLWFIGKKIYSNVKKEILRQKEIESRKTGNKLLCKTILDSRDSDSILDKIRK